MGTMANIKHKNDGFTDIALLKTPANRAKNPHKWKSCSQPNMRVSHDHDTGRCRITANGKSGKFGGGAKNTTTRDGVRRYLPSKSCRNLTDRTELENEDTDDRDIDENSYDSCCLDSGDIDDDDDDDDDNQSSPVAKISRFYAFFHWLFPTAFPAPKLYQARIKSTRSVTSWDRRNAGKMMYPEGRSEMFPNGLFVRAIDGHDVTRIYFPDSGQTFKPK